MRTTKSPQRILPGQAARTVHSRTTKPPQGILPGQAARTVHSRTTKPAQQSKPSAVRQVTYGRPTTTRPQPGSQQQSQAQLSPNPVPAPGTSYFSAVSTKSSFCIVSNISNGAGLQKDYEILQRLIEERGHAVTGEHRGRGTPYRCDVVIFLEVVDAKWFGHANQYWLVPNSEWWYDEWSKHLPNISAVLCKTKDCLSIWQKKVGRDKCRYTGWEAVDFYDPKIPREPKFLHIAGLSGAKNTKAVTDAWRNHGLTYPLTILTTNPNVAKYCHGVESIKLLGRVLQKNLIELINSHQFFVMPSQYEGYGMALHEAAGCGSVIITTDASPMNEIAGLVSEIQVPEERRVPYRAATLSHVNPSILAEKIHKAASMSSEELAVASENVRAGFLSEREHFRSAFSEMVKPALGISFNTRSAADLNKHRDIVIVTTYFRPEYLWMCLASIAEADGGQSKEIWISQDHHQNDKPYRVQDEENAEIVDNFSKVFASLRYIDRKATSYKGNSYNCLEAYKEAYGTDARYVYLIEDDVMIERDFFRWHETAQSMGDYFCTIARPCPHSSAYVSSDDPAAYVESGSDYVSIGVCWKREKLAPIVAHCKEEYYASTGGYIRRHFPNSRMGAEFTEQDGLIQRLLIDSGQKSAWPCLKRSYHIGVTGYHRPNGFHFNGRLQNKIKQLSDAIQSGSLPKLGKDFIELNDIDLPPSSPPVWSNIHVSQRLP